MWKSSCHDIQGDCDAPTCLTSTGSSLATPPPPPPLHPHSHSLSAGLQSFLAWTCFTSLPPGLPASHSHPALPPFSGDNYEGRSGHTALSNLPNSPAFSSSPCLWEEIQARKAARGFPAPLPLLPSLSPPSPLLLQLCFPSSPQHISCLGLCTLSSGLCQLSALEIPSAASFLISPPSEILLCPRGRVPTFA